MLSFWLTLVYRGRGGCNGYAIPSFLIVSKVLWGMSLCDRKVMSPRLCLPWYPGASVRVLAQKIGVYSLHTWCVIVYLVHFSWHVICYLETRRLLEVMVRAAMTHFLTIRCISRYRCHNTIHSTIHHYIQLTSDVILRNCFEIIYTLTREDIFWRTACFTHGRARLYQLTTNWNYVMYACVCAATLKSMCRMGSMQSYTKQGWNFLVPSFNK